MKIDATPLSGLQVILNAAVGDARGRFTRVFCEQELGPIHPNLHFTQINLSETRDQGAVRGMHYQLPPSAEAKFIRCLRGRVFDVAVDLRTGSRTFLQWHAIELSYDNQRAVFIPEGFAHGFQALTDDVQMLYLHTAPYAPQHEAGVRHDDPSLAITWPLPVTMLSDRDRGYPSIDDGFMGVRV
ncbi:MAG TPA: dTDP-4-dehydrorhamnose 3,5-epimerase family protein [Xanthomonadaceae bacterium]|nr:dTDP-4-dehydrorhamnose 3,5-epimerase family protein [Xanthomonadaceae bacterium]